MMQVTHPRYVDREEAANVDVNDVFTDKNS